MTNYDENDLFQIPDNAGDIAHTHMPEQASELISGESILDQPDHNPAEQARWLNTVSAERRVESAEELKSSIAEGRVWLDRQHDQNHFVEETQTPTPVEYNKLQREIGRRGTDASQDAASRVLPWRMSASTDKEVPGSERIAA